MHVVCRILTFCTKCGWALSERLNLAAQRAHVMAHTRSKTLTPINSNKYVIYAHNIDTIMVLNCQTTRCIQWARINCIIGKGPPPRCLAPHHFYQLKSITTMAESARSQSYSSHVRRANASDSFCWHVQLNSIHNRRPCAQANRQCGEKIGRTCGSIEWECGAACACALSYDIGEVQKNAAAICGFLFDNLFHSMSQFLLYYFSHRMRASVNSHLAGRKLITTVSAGASGECASEQAHREHKKF